MKKNFGRTILFLSGHTKNKFDVQKKIGRTKKKMVRPKNVFVRPKNFFRTSGFLLFHFSSDAELRRHNVTQSHENQVEMFVTLDQLKKEKKKHF